MLRRPSPRIYATAIHWVPVLDIDFLFLNQPKEVYVIEAVCSSEVDAVLFHAFQWRFFLRFRRLGSLELYFHVLRFLGSFRGFQRHVIALHF